MKTIQLRTEKESEGRKRSRKKECRFELKVKWGERVYFICVEKRNVRVAVNRCFEFNAQGGA